MSSKRFAFLAVLLLLIFGGGAFVILSEHASLDRRAGAAAGEPLLPSLNISDVREILLRSSRGQTTLTLNSDGVWRIHERKGYPARTELVNTLLFQLANAKVTEVIPVPEKRLNRLGLTLPPLPDAPDTFRKVVEVSDAPLSIELFNAQGEPLSPPLVCGETVLPQDAQSNPLSKLMARHYLIAEKPYTVCLSSEPLTRMTAAPSEWLDKSFVIPGEIASMTFAPPPPMRGWEIARQASAMPFEMVGLQGVADSGIFDAETADTATFFLNALCFEDVAPASRVKPGAVSRLSVEAFDGRSYHFALSGWESGDIWTTVEVRQGDGVLKTPFDNWSFKIPRHSLTRILKDRCEWFHQIPDAAIQNGR